ncbi:MAG: DUF4192 domain-containing protein [Actinomycetes bacterium]
MTTETLRATEPRDLLATIPFLLGFEPSRSLVALSLRGGPRRVGAVARLDLPAPGEAADPLAERLVAHLRRDRATETVLVVYDEDCEAHHEMVDAAEQALQTSGIPLLDVWLVADGRYRSLRCAGECCPAEGRPLDELRSSRLAAELTWRGLAVAKRRSCAILDLAPAAPSRLVAVESFAVRHRPPAPGTDGRRRPTWAATALAGWRTEVARARASCEPDADQAGDRPSDLGDSDGRSGYLVGAETAGLLLAALDDVAVRDAVMLTCVPGSETEPERFAVEAVPTPRTERLFDLVFSTGAGVAPRACDVQAASLVLASLVRQATGARAVPPLALLAWLTWWCGDGGSSLQYLERALEAEPSYRLAVLLQTSLERGVAPGWVEQERRDGEPSVDSGRSAR